MEDKLVAWGAAAGPCIPLPRFLGPQATRAPREHRRGFPRLRLQAARNGSAVPPKGRHGQPESRCWEGGFGGLPGVAGTREVWKLAGLSSTEVISEWMAAHPAPSEPVSCGRLPTPGTHTRHTVTQRAPEKPRSRLQTSRFH